MENCQSGKLKLGWASAFHPESEDDPIIMNMATQVKTGPQASLKAIEECIAGVLSWCDQWGYTSLGLPQIGCGIGGLKWEDVSLSIKVHAEESNCDITVVIYGKEKAERQAV